MNGQDPVTVCTSSLVVLKVFFLGVRGLQKANHTDKTRLHCSALVDTLPASEVLTRVRPGGGDRAKWDEEVNVHGFDSGDRITFRLWGANADGSCEDVLGEAHIESQGLLESGFDGELPLCCNGQAGPIYLSVMIVPMDMSPHTMDSEGNVQDGGQPAVHVSVTGISI
uniref:C2 domain-containing protein n=1 Tax=Alexandrium catenella TaxID=2925 RepID=A0A7S1RBX9_ALECA